MGGQIGKTSFIRPLKGMNIPPLKIAFVGSRVNCQALKKYKLFFCASVAIPVWCQALHRSPHRLSPMFHSIQFL